MKYFWTYYSCRIKIKVNGDNIGIVYKMSSYTSKVVHVEDFPLNLFPLIYNNNAYPSVDNNGGVGSCNVIPASGCLCDTVVCDNAFFQKQKKHGYKHRFSSITSPHCWLKIWDLLKQNRYCHKCYHSQNEWNYFF